MLVLSPAPKGSRNVAGAVKAPERVRPNFEAPQGATENARTTAHRPSPLTRLNPHCALFPGPDRPRLHSAALRGSHVRNVSEQEDNIFPSKLYN
jgi:hypothetical protein